MVADNPNDKEPRVGRDLLEIHRVVMREPLDPGEGRERGPWWLWAGILLAVFSGGFYLGRFSGVFFRDAVHVGYLPRPLKIMSQPSDTAPATSASASKGEEIQAGQKIFSTTCIVCHQATGQGVPGSFPPLAGSPWVLQDEDTVIRIVLHGLGGPVVVKGAPFNGSMPAWESSLSDAQIADVISYIRTNWGNHAEPVTASEVARIRQATKDHNQPWTSEDLENLRNKK